MARWAFLIPSTTPDDQVNSAIFSKIEDVVDIYSGPDILFAGLDLLSPGQRAMYAIRWCTEEIFNGGFDQLFFNSTGILAHEALNGFQLFEAEAHYKVFREATAAFDGAQVPLVREKRIQALYASPFRAELAEVTGRFQEIEDSDSVDGYVRRYIEAHKFEFITAD